METFASYEDLMAGWPSAPDVDRRAAVELLERASAHLAGLMRAHGVEVDPKDEVQAVNLRSVTCSMARRALSQGYDGVASFAQSVGSTNVSVSYRDPDGGFYLSRSDRELLGLAGRGGARMLRAAIRRPDGSPAGGW